MSYRNERLELWFDSSELHDVYAAMRIAEGWYSVMNWSDPGVSLYKFYSTGRIQSEEHRQDCLNYIDNCINGDERYAGHPYMGSAANGLKENEALRKKSFECSICEDHEEWSDQCAKCSTEELNALRSYIEAADIEPNPLN